jgi:hypothetical protein
MGHVTKISPAAIYEYLLVRRELAATGGIPLPPTSSRITDKRLFPSS